MRHAYGNAHIHSDSDCDGNCHIHANGDRNSYAYTDSYCQRRQRQQHYATHATATALRRVSPRPSPTPRPRPTPRGHPSNCFDSSDCTGFPKTDTLTCVECLVRHGGMSWLDELWDAIRPVRDLRGTRETKLASSRTPALGFPQRVQREVFRRLVATPPKTRSIYVTGGKIIGKSIDVAWRA